MDTKNVREAVDKLFGKDNDFSITVKVACKDDYLELGENVLDGEILMYLIALKDTIRRTRKEK